MTDVSSEVLQLWCCPGVEAAHPAELMTAMMIMSVEMAVEPASAGSFQTGLLQAAAGICQAIHDSGHRSAGQTDSALRLRTSVC